MKKPSKKDTHTKRTPNMWPSDKRQDFVMFGYFEACRWHSDTAFPMDRHVLLQDCQELFKGRILIDDLFFD